jgi:hypothetical protein
MAPKPTCWKLLENAVQCVQFDTAGEKFEGVINVELTGKILDWEGVRHQLPSAQGIKCIPKIVGCIGKAIEGMLTDCQCVASKQTVPNSVTTVYQAGRNINIGGVDAENTWQAVTEKLDAVGGWEGALGMFVTAVMIVITIIGVICRACYRRGQVSLKNLRKLKTKR